MSEANEVYEGGQVKGLHGHTDGGAPKGDADSTMPIQLTGEGKLDLKFLGLQPTVSRKETSVGDGQRASYRGVEPHRFDNCD